MMLKLPGDLWKEVTADRQGESWFVLDGLAGTVLGSRQSILVGFEGETASYGRFYDGNIGRVALVPSYRLQSGALETNLGSETRSHVQK